MPSGEMADQIGTRRCDLILAWPKDDGAPLDEARFKSRWPESQGIQKVAENLFLVRGVEIGGVKEQGPQAIVSSPNESPARQAEEVLAAARRAGDMRRLVSALTDLGIVLTRERKAQKAVELLEEALSLVGPLGDRALESDVLDNLGMAVMAVSQPQRALELFQQGLGDARIAGDRFAEKMALFHIGLAFSVARDFNLAFSLFDQALTIAREVGDKQHEADLLWQMGIVHSEKGDRDQAVARAQDALSLYRQVGNPQVDWLEGQLQKYRAGQISAPLAGVGLAEPPSASIFGGQIVTSGWTDQGFLPSQSHGTSGPGLLRMAFSAMKSMAHFAGSGFKPAPTSIHQKRLQICSQCEHHTGMRCRICGCFTSVKAWMPHESCPIGKWKGETH
jgi:tetratricopeptide (TPR) repeat protein